MNLFRLRIGITSTLVGDQAPLQDKGGMQHCAALERARATPVILRNDMDPTRIIETLALNGIVFSGGGDIGAARYGGNEALSQDNLDLQRDSFEFALMGQALKVGLPIFAICRGMQVANVALGGTLIEDLRHHMGTKYRIAHRVKDANVALQEHAHTVSVASDTMLHDIVETECFAVNSNHHQAIGEIAPELRASAHADDGVIEAIEFADSGRSFFVGVQWHPECLLRDPFSRVLYARLLQACEEV